MQSSTLPQTLYKYTTASTAKLLLDGLKLRWSSPNLFNDVAEFRRMPRFAPTLTRAHLLFLDTLADHVLGIQPLDSERLPESTHLIITTLKELLQTGADRAYVLNRLRLPERPDADDRLERMLRAYVASIGLDTFRVLCLTASPNNEVMWGTYAESHRGCVLGFRHIPDLDTPLYMAKPVTYSDEPPVVGSGLDFLIYGDNPAFRKATLDAIAYSKRSRWSYEEEWRVVTVRPDESAQFGDYKFYPDELESITFGVRAEQSFVEEVKRLARKFPSVRLYQMDAHFGNLQREPCDT